MGQASTSRADMIKWLDSVQDHIDNACYLIEDNKDGEALGVLHTVLSRMDALELRLLTEEAKAKEEEREIAEQEVVLR